MLLESVPLGVVTWTVPVVAPVGTMAVNGAGSDCIAYVAERPPAGAFPGMCGTIRLLPGEARSESCASVQPIFMLGSFS